MTLALTGLAGFSVATMAFPGASSTTRAVRASRCCLSRFSAFRADAGDTLDIEVPSGAGYGSPLDDSPAAVLADLLDGLIDEEAAVAIYGVVMTSDVLDIDLAATVAARRAIAASQES